MTVTTSRVWSAVLDGSAALLPLLLATTLLLAVVEKSLGAKVWRQGLAINQDASGVLAAAVECTATNDALLRKVKELRAIQRKAAAK